MAEQQKRKINIPMFLAAVLFCATLISMHFMGGLYARYTTNGAGSDSARVITFGDVKIIETGDFVVDTESGKESLMIIPGVELDKKAVVNFEGSEALCLVFVEVIPSSGWATTDKKTFKYVHNETEFLSWTIDDSWKIVESAGATSYVYYQVVEPNNSLTDDIIANGVVTVSEDITKMNMADLKTANLDITVNFKATAVQANGFKTIDEAWASVDTNHN